MQLLHGAVVVMVCFPGLATAGVSDVASGPVAEPAPSTVDAQPPQADIPGVPAADPSSQQPDSQAEPGKDQDKLVATIHAGKNGLHIRCPACKDDDPSGAEDHDQGKEFKKRFESVDIDSKGIHVRMRHDADPAHVHKVVHVKGPTPASVLAGVFGMTMFGAGTLVTLVSGVALIADAIWLAVLVRNGNALTVDKQSVAYVSKPLALLLPLGILAGSGVLVSTLAGVLVNRNKHTSWSHEEEVIDVPSQTSPTP